MLIVDAATGIDEDTVVLTAKIGDAPEVVLTPDSLEDCDDLNLDKIACSPDRELELQGLRIEATLDGAGQDSVGLGMTAKNASLPASEVFDSFTIDTIPNELEITFRLTSPVSIGTLLFDIDYSATDGTFAGTGDGVDCTSLLDDEVLVSFDDRDDSDTLAIAISAKPGFPGPSDLATCRFVNFDNLPSSQSFPLTVLEAADGNSVPLQTLPSVSTSIEVVQ
jgi:hypothetical protein